MAEGDHSELNRYSLDDIVIPATQLPATAQGARPPSYRSILRSSLDRGKYELLESLSTKKLRRGSTDDLYEISGWPRRPEQLKTIRNRVKHAVADLFMAGVALLWLVYGAYVYNLNGSPAHGTETQLVEAGRIGTTLVPYVYAAIGSMVLSAVARWRLELGARFMTIDQLYTSTTMIQTLKTLCRLRTVNILGIALGIFWCLSPLGSQATQRVASIRTRTESSTAPFTWVDTVTSYRQWSNNASAATLNSIAAVQNAAMMASESIETTATDQWKNLKVPLLESLNISASPNWTTLANNSTQVYSSLIGVPIVNHNMLGSTSFNFTASYWYANCSNLRNTYGITPNPHALTNFTSEYSVFSANNYSLWQIAVLNRKLNDATQPSLPFFLEVVGQGSSAQPLLVHMDCNLTTSTVDLQASCDSTSTCSMDAVRYSPDYSQDTFFPPLGPGVHSDQNQTSLYQFLRNFASSFPASRTGTGSSIFERYLGGGLFQPSVQASFYATISNISAAEFGVSLSELFNTYWLSSIAPVDVISGLQATPSSNDNSVENNLHVINSERAVYSQIQYLHCDMTWFGLLVVSSLLLFLASIAAGILRLFLRGPDVLDIVSALTMPNTVRVPGNGSFMDRDERSRLLAEKRIRLGDVSVGDGFGRTAIGDEGKVREFQEGRFYV